MPQFDSAQLAIDAQGEWATPCINGICGFSFDSRKTQPGDMFVALKTDSQDGHDFLEAALAAGASAALVQDDQVNYNINLPQLKVSDTLKALQSIACAHRKRFDGLVIGITGSCGKTTVKDLISHLIGDETVCSNYLNYNNLLGVPITLLGADSKQHKYLVVEAGTNLPGEMEQLASMIKSDISIITNICPVHLEGLKSIENIANEKFHLAKATTGPILFPSSCLKYEPFKKLNRNVRILASQTESDLLSSCDTIVMNCAEFKDSKVELTLQIPDFSFDFYFTLPLLSPGILSSVSLAISACLLANIPADQIQTRLDSWQPSLHRGQVYHYGNQTYYADCYNANSVSMKDSLGIFQKRFSQDNDLLYVLGSMGELGPNAPQYHYEVGSSLKIRPQDKVLLLGDNADDYAQGLKAVGTPPHQIILLKNKEEAFELFEGFEGAIFLKGSKCYALWELLPSEAQLADSQKVISC